MFINFFKKDKFSKISKVKTDMHSHLIPSIDDGSSSIQSSVDILKYMSKIGYKKVITTPHTISDIYPNSTKSILKGLDSLNDALRGSNIDIEIEVASEYYMDDEFLNRLNIDDILTMGDNKYLLFETSYNFKPIYFEEVIFQMINKGYRPILAHPERYKYFLNPKEDFLRLKELGIYLQLDINSLGGHYGKLAKKSAKILVDLGIVDFIGSDVHHIKQVSFLENIFATKEYHNIFLKNKILNDTL